jgi:hypothetical protein
MNVSKRTPRRSPLVIPKSWVTLDNLVLFFLPICSIISFNLGGELLLSDVLALAVFFVYLKRGRITFREPFLQIIIVLISAWFVSAVISDVLNASSIRNILRGWLKIGFFAAYLIVIFTSVGSNRKRLAICLFGLAVALTLKADISALDDIDGAFRTVWKFGTGFGVSLLLAFLLTYLTKNRRLSSLSLVVLSPVHLLLGSRSLFLQTFLAGILTYFSTHVRAGRQRVYAGIIFGFVFIVSLIGGQIVYDSVVRAGVFGQEARTKHEMQTASGGNVILGARSESIIATIAIKDKPFFGHGSWAENRTYRMLYFKLKEMKGETIDWDSSFTNQSTLIPSHSMLLGAMVEHGLLGGLFWMYALSLAVRAIFASILGPQPANYYEMVVLFSLVWDIFFSPFGAARRCTEAIFLVTCAVLISSNSTSVKPNQDL